MSLLGRVDFYKCLHIYLDVLPTPLAPVLADSLPLWLSQDIKGVWLRVPNTQLDLLPVCQTFGFYPHHTTPSGITMAKWLDSTPNTLPTYSTHYVGVCGVIINEKNEILLVRNRASVINVIEWRPPGGLVEANEFLMHAAVREVKEETGVEAEALGVIGFREMMRFQFDRPDLSVLVLMRPISCELSVAPEVTHCQWMEFSTWLDSDLPGDARNLIKSMYTSRSAPPLEFFQSRTLNFSLYNINLPIYNATHHHHATHAAEATNPALL